MNDNRRIRLVGRDAHLYLNVVVLLLCWEKEMEGCWSDVKSLENVFSLDYRFETSIFQIPERNSEKAVLNRLTKIKEKSLERDSLLIVGYTGHGGVSRDQRFMVSAFEV
ncbi:hypothetical protein BKA64DRAFT_658608 [Cadophora sp. MPI-SDFR-AT-0126]|nr:hypothetical protein BKA64DRAFT_658608 [Leotiomycetes sp. MPI-SDFR-AT-0126]